MPRILQSAQRDCARADEAECQPSPIAHKRELVSVPRTPPSTPEEMTANSLSLLWNRLFASYVNFTQPNSESFVVDGVVSADNTLKPHMHTSSNIFSDVRYTPFTVIDDDWASGFGSSRVEELIFHYYLNNEPFDTFSWVIAFCLIDKLQLEFYVHQRLRFMSLGSPAGTESPPSPTGFLARWGNPETQTPFRLSTASLFEALFTVYSLALKSHLDYSVTLNYLVNLLPHQGHTRRQILQGAAALEHQILDQLHFNCFVHQDQVIQLLDHFLTITEREYILSAVAR